jgi:CRISPR-associated endonuclease/helicase Cas3
LVRELGARVFAMSATFPTVLKQVLHDTLGGELPEISADAATQAAFRRHRLTVMEDDLLGEAAARTIQARVRAGEAVLVVATTVARAQQLYGNLAGRLGAGVVSLLHSRFTGKDRARKEAKLADEVGTGVQPGNKVWSWLPRRSSRSAWTSTSTCSSPTTPPSRR